MSIVFSGVIAFVMTFICGVILCPLAKRLELVDMPGGRKHHDGLIPLVGGIAMLIGFSFALLTLDISLSSYRSFIACLALLVFVGVLDDFHELSARPRLFIQIFAMVLMVTWGKVMLLQLGHLFGGGEVRLGIFSIPLTILAGIGIINAVNMTDGIDGLAGSLGFVEIMMLYFLALFKGQNMDAIILLLFACSLLAFLCLNFPLPGRRRALIFMGDAGSMFIGFVLIWFLISLSQGPVNTPPVIMLWIMTLPIFDVFYVMIKRIREKRSPFKADRFHFHHALQKAGCPPMLINGMMIALALFFGMFGITGHLLGVQDSWLFVFWWVLFVIYFISLNKAWKSKRFILQTE